MFYFFPYGDIRKGSNVIMYGGGKVGSCFESQIRNRDYCNILAIADQSIQRIKDNPQFKDYCVITPEKMREFDFDYIIVAVGTTYRQSALDSVRDALGDDNRVFYQDYYCQQSWTTESIVVKKVFDVIGVEKPSFWDVGACYPHMSSNTALFYTEGCRGLNIEADETLKEYFLKYRPEDTNIFAGISDHNGEESFMICDDPYLSSFSPDAARFSEAYWNAKYLEKRTIKTYTLNYISDKYYHNGFPDFLDIDIEGFDERALRSVDFSEDSPKVILVEGNPQRFNSILMDKKCESEGYHPYCRIEANTIYLRNDIYKKVLCI